MEKLVLTLVTAARKLRPYFQAHTIEVTGENAVCNYVPKCAQVYA